VAHRLLCECEQEQRVDTLVDPVEAISGSSSHLKAAQAVEPARATFASLDPDAQVQWFSRELTEEVTSSIEVDVSWDEESDTAPTLILRRRPH
jgi:hypothetical protein